MVFQLDSEGAKVCKSSRSCQELSNAYLLPKFGVETAENGPLKFAKNYPKLFQIGKLEIFKTQIVA